MRRVRELAERYGAARTQDGVVDLAVERLYVEAQDRAERELWSTAATDPEFRSDVASIARDLDEPDSWPA